MLTSDSTRTDGFRLRLRGGPDAAGVVRKQLSQLRTEIEPPVLENVRLLATELVTNAVRHAEAETVDVAVIVGRQRVRTEIANTGHDFDSTPGTGEGGPNGGWGLFLVDRLSDDWGVIDEPDLQRVWFEIGR